MVVTVYATGRETDMSKYGTNFQETEAILAAQEGDTKYLSEVLAGMLPGERARLGEAADLLSDMVDDPLVREAAERMGIDSYA